MKITIEGITIDCEPQEITALVSEVQKRPVNATKLNHILKNIHPLLNSAKTTDEMWEIARREFEPLGIKIDYR